MIFGWPKLSILICPFHMDRIIIAKTAQTRSSYIPKFIQPYSWASTMYPKRDCSVAGSILLLYGSKTCLRILSISNGQSENQKSKEIMIYKPGSLPIISQNQIRRHNKWFGYARGRPRLSGPQNNEKLSKNLDICSKYR